MSDASRADSPVVVSDATGVARRSLLKGTAGILALNEVSTVGAGRALRDLSLGGKVRLVGFDSSLFEIKLIEEGILDATVIQQPFNMGYRSVRAARDAVDGRKPETFIDTGSILITAENLYTPENQKILFPFVDRIRD